MFWIDEQFNLTPGWSCHCLALFSYQTYLFRCYTLSRWLRRVQQDKDLDQLSANLFEALNCLYFHKSMQRLPNRVGDADMMMIMYIFFFVWEIFLLWCFCKTDEFHPKSARGTQINLEKLLLCSWTSETTCINHGLSFKKKKKNYSALLLSMESKH